MTTNHHKQKMAQSRGERIWQWETDLWSTVYDWVYLLSQRKTQMEIYKHIGRER